MRKSRGHPEQQHDLLSFYQPFPLLFQRQPPHPPPHPPEPWLQELFSFEAQEPNYVRVVPQTFEALRWLSSGALIVALHQWGYTREISPADGEGYFATLGLSRAEWQASQEAVEAQRSEQELKSVIQWLQGLQQEHPDILSPEDCRRLIDEAKSYHNRPVSPNDFLDFYHRYAKVLLKAITKGFVDHPVVKYWLT